MTGRDYAEEVPMLTAPKTPLYGSPATATVADVNIERNIPPEVRTSWIRMKFCQINLLLLLITLICVIVLTVCIVIAARLQTINEDYERLKDQSKTWMRQFEPQPSALHGEDVAQVPTREDYDQMNGYPPPIRPMIYNPDGPKGSQENPREHGVLTKTVQADDNSVEVEAKEKLVEDLKTEDPYRWYKEGGKCGKMDHCPKSSLFHTVHRPLVVISFDGFSREYVDRKIMKNLQYMAECGTTTEYVIPSYPTKTFPNHYTIATGLFPGAHGLVDNLVYDRNISSDMIDMKRSVDKRLYGGEPIWSVYQKQTKKKAGCMMFIGCSVDRDDKPELLQSFDMGISDEKKIETVADWLSLPEESRPGLVMAYFDQPDNSGHNKVSSDPLVNNTLVVLDHLLGHFLNILHDRKLLDCIDVVFLSDHGMHDVDNFINLNKKGNLVGVPTTNGVVARMHLEDEKKAMQDEFAEPYKCNKGEQFMVYNRSNLPPRYHFSESDRSGDIIIEGVPGTIFKTDDQIDREGDHGYDYLEPSMRTVFFARGPSFQRGKVLPPFQNVEYFNLFAELLGIPNPPATNGTLGILKDALITSKVEVDEFYKRDQPIPECPRHLGFTTMRKCDCGSSKVTFRLPGCFNPPNPLFIRSDGPGFCSKSLCESTVVVRDVAGKAKSLTFTETVKRGDNVTHGMDCVFGIGFVTFENYSDKCPEDKNTTMETLAVGSEFSSYVDARLPLREGFSKSIWHPLQNLTRAYANDSGKVLSISGAIWELKDDHFPSYLYRILLRCNGEWGPEEKECAQGVQGDVLSFLIPHFDEEWNCLPTNTLLLKYSARVKDIEQLTGLRYFRDERLLSYKDAIWRKTFVPQKLW